MRSAQQRVASFTALLEAAVEAGPSAAGLDGTNAVYWQNALTMLLGQWKSLTVYVRTSEDFYRVATKFGEQVNHFIKNASQHGQLSAFLYVQELVDEKL